MAKPTAQVVHDKRKITFAELGALLGTRTMIANNLIVHVPDPDNMAEQLDGRMEEGEHLFTMEITCKSEGCGSIGCIAGTMALIMGIGVPATYVSKHFHDPEFNTRPIAKLFYPPQRYDYSKITPKQAVKAIDNFLEYGNPKWASILGKKAHR